MKMPREFYIPKNAVKVAMKDNGAVFYLYESKDTPCALCFVGRAQKPTWHFRFKSTEDREKRIRNQIKSVAERKRLKAERAAKLKAESRNLPSIGTVLNTCWGYDQMNREFFQVVGHKGKCTVILREIAQVQHYTQDMAGKTAPINDDFIGQPFERRWNGRSAKITSFAYASEWCGKPVDFSCYH